MRRFVLCYFLIFLTAFSVAKEEAGPNSSDPAVIVDWFMERDLEFIYQRRDTPGDQKIFKATFTAELAALPAAAAIEHYSKKHAILLKWVAQYLSHQRYAKRGKYSPDESAYLHQLAAELQTIPTAAQLQTAGYEVSEKTESALAGKMKVAAFYCNRKYGIKPKSPAPEDEALIRKEIFNEK